MDARKEFARELVAFRKERGYPTAYAFFHKSGGVKRYGFSYTHYLRLERGARLPGLDSLELILDALGSPFAFAQRRKELLVLFLKATVGDAEKLLKPVFDALEPAADDDDLLMTVARQEVSEVPRMTDAQLEAVTSDPAAFWILEWLVGTGMARTPEELAAETGVSGREAAAALETLARAKLLTQDKKGRYFSENFKTALYPPNSKTYQSRRLWLAEQFQKKVAAKGSDHFYGYLTLAVESEKRAAALTQLFREALYKSLLLRAKSPRPEGPLLAVEARVSAVLPAKAPSRA